MTLIRIAAAALFAAASINAQAQDIDAKAPPTRPAATSSIEKSVVKIFTTLRRPDPYSAHVASI